MVVLMRLELEALRVSRLVSTPLTPIYDTSIGHAQTCLVQGWKYVWSCTRWCAYLLLKRIANKREKGPHYSTKPPITLSNTSTAVLWNSIESHRIYPSVAHNCSMFRVGSVGRSCGTAARSFSSSARQVTQEICLLSACSDRILRLLPATPTPDSCDLRRSTGICWL